MRPLVEILSARAADGTDCTQDESALLKRHVREHPNSFWTARIRVLFPVEYDEATGRR